MSWSKAQKGNLTSSRTDIIVLSILRWGHWSIEIFTQFKEQPIHCTLWLGPTTNSYSISMILLLCPRWEVKWTWSRNWPSRYPRSEPGLLLSTLYSGDVAASRCFTLGSPKLCPLSVVNCSQRGHGRLCSFVESKEDSMTNKDNDWKPLYYKAHFCSVYIPQNISRDVIW